MPIWLRNFTFNKIKDFYDKQSEAESKMLKQQDNKKPKIARPDIQPTYSTKASK